jgi:predicted AlkP superfamily pyrophosphatase or phosphodiesterase
MLGMLLLGFWTVHAQQSARPAVATATLPVAEAADTARSVPAPATSRHVIIISVDGLRPDAITRFRAPTLQRLMREGAYSLSARTIDPSRTLPSHTSMVTGVKPDVHGITWNENLTHDHGLVASPTIFSVATAAGLRTARFFSKGKFNHLIIPGTFNHSSAPLGDGMWFAGRTTDRVAAYLARERPNLMMVHIGEPDYAGHAFGWMGTVYGWAVRRADTAVGRVIAAADRAFGPGGYTLLLTSDHGGHRRTHGSADPRDVTIPWIAWGRGVSAGTELTHSIHTTDTAATALWLLGLSLPSATGVPVTEAFHSALSRGDHTQPAEVLQ